MTYNQIPTHTLDKIVRDPRALAAAVEPLRPHKRLVMVKGAYDLFHIGHYYSFINAKAYGDILIVAVNDDMAIEDRKGPGRPILPLGDRVTLIAALECVDFVTVYSSPSPFDVLSVLRPDVFAASHFSSLSAEQRELIERTTRFEVVPKQGEISTSAVIAKIKRLADAKD